MYGKLGVALVKMGWPAPIPLVPREKRPALARWERFNTQTVSEERAEEWARLFPNYGVGHAAGHGLVGIDLDTDKRSQSSRARVIADEHLGPTPMIRVGRSPRVMRYYRLERASIITVSTRAFHLFGIYATTGQTAWYGTHPVTGRPYRWPSASPMDLAPGDLPELAGGALEKFAVAMASAFPPPPSGRERRAGQFNGLRASGEGITTKILREIGLTPRTPPAEVAGAWVETAVPGTRHQTMVAAVTALANVGLSDQEIFEAVAGGHLAVLAGDRPERQTLKVVRSAIAWARRRVGRDLDDLDRDLNVNNWSIWQ